MKIEVAIATCKSVRSSLIMYIDNYLIVRMYFM